MLVGDGAFRMTGWELGNAARLGLDPIELVFNNAGWEMLRAFEPGHAIQRTRHLGLRLDGRWHGR